MKHRQAPLTSTHFAGLLLAMGAGLLAVGCGEKDAPPGSIPASGVGSSQTAPPTEAGRQLEEIPTFSGTEPSVPASSSQHKNPASTPSTAVPATPATPPRPKLRRGDDRPVHDDARLAEVGVHKYSSQRFILYTDIDPEVARTLPPLVDAAYDAWIDYFGPLPEAEDGSDFQITGYIIRDRRPFVELGLLPEELVAFQHGQHRTYRFWMWEQKFDYYRRHLLLHEATHCFMLIQEAQTRPPLWYLEGMAERFGCHTIDAEGNVSFRVIPDQHENFVGFGRIEMIHDAITQGKFLTIDDVHLITANEFAVDRAKPYAWSWALCTLLDTHPRYRDRFRKLGKFIDGGEFLAQLHDMFQPDLPLLHADWEFFTHTLSYGHDIERTVIDYRRGEELPPGGSLGVKVDADRGWQTTGITVQPGVTYQITATGEVSLAQTPQPWTSEPQGISIRYCKGRPIGRLLAAIQTDAPPDASGEGRLMHEIDIGRSGAITPKVAGTLYLRVNDFWGEIRDNQGAYQSTISALPTTP